MAIRLSITSGLDIPTGVATRTSKCPGSESDSFSFPTRTRINSRLMTSMAGSFVMLRCCSVPPTTTWVRVGWKFLPAICCSAIGSKLKTCNGNVWRMIVSQSYLRRLQSYGCSCRRFDSLEASYGFVQGLRTRTA